LVLSLKSRASLANLDAFRLRAATAKVRQQSRGWIES
jgi:hypothetical protein